MKKLLKKKLQNIPKYLIILLAITTVGIFLRSYNFHSWLNFSEDQVRDATLAGQVVDGESSWPLLGPYMNHSGINIENSFHLGPIYYYFQIVSAEIFGSSPEKMAYPDLFFSILSIPLFYLFLRIYFEKGLSLSIVGLYAISFYFIENSRFAWNVNPIPFFVLLFLFSIYKFLDDDEKTSWHWTIPLGCAWGVGFQLHAIIMVLFSIVIFLVFLFSMKKNLMAWKKWAVVLLVFIVLNTGQIISESRTNLSNTKTLITYFVNQLETPGDSNLVLLSNDTDCNAEANFYFLSSYGDNNCQYSFSGIISSTQTHGFSKILKYNSYLMASLVSLVFSVTGYYFLIYYNIKEADKRKKYFLRLIMLYAGISYLIMIPLSVASNHDLRYFMATFFVPFLFLGFFIKFISEKFTTKYIFPAIMIFCMLAYTNIKAIAAETINLSDDNMTCATDSYTLGITLGEIQPVANYMSRYADNQKNVYFLRNSELFIITDPLTYLLKQQGLNLVRVSESDGPALAGKPIFGVSCKLSDEHNQSYQKIGSMFIYQLSNGQPLLSQVPDTSKDKS